MSDEHTSHPFAGPLAAMEAEIAAAEARGDPVMPQAYAMVARLRELMQALDGLNASLETGPAAQGAPDAPPKAAPGDAPGDAPGAPDPSADERAPG